MDLEHIDRIKKLVIIALFSDDELMDSLVLKGGNAIDLVHGAAMRGSIDLDFSIENDLPESSDENLRSRFDSLLNLTLQPEGLRAFDVSFSSRPPQVTPDLREFWGGYRLEFKVIHESSYEALKKDTRKLRTGGALSIAPGHRKKLRVDISCHEFCAPKQQRELDGYRIYVYTPEMIVCEKLRAICQQMPEYRSTMHSVAGSQRARDFFDICALVEHYRIDLRMPSNLEFLRRMFAAKRVPMALLREIPRYRDYHRAGFPAVRDTVKPGVRLHDFDYYFDYVLGLVDDLLAFGIE